MSYTIKLSKKAQKFIKALSGTDNAYRLRVGDYRVIYEVYHDILLVSVVNIGNRGQIYKSM